MGDYSFDRKRAGKVFRQLVNSYANKEYLFSEKRIFLPDEIIPLHIETGSAEHALYLFTAAPLTKREVSFKVLERFRTFCEQSPDFLTIEQILNSTLGRIENVLADDVGAGFATSRAKAIRHNFEILDREYLRDARNIFNGLPVRDSIDGVAGKFMDYGTKTSAMVAMWFQKYGLANFKDPHNLLPAIDIHKIRISKMTGVIDFNPEAKRIREVLARDFARELSDFCRSTEQTKNPVNIMLLDEALWILGSEVCAKKNATICYQKCPIYDCCSRDFIAENRYSGVFESSPIANASQECFPFIRNI